MWVFLVPYWLGVLVLIPSFSFFVKISKVYYTHGVFNLNLVAANNIFCATLHNY